MSSEIQKINSQQPAPVPMTLNGDNGTQIANVEQYVDSKRTMIYAPSLQLRHSPEEIDAGIKFDYSCYHLFVTDDEAFDGQSFLIKKAVVFTESTPKVLQSRYGTLSQYAIEKIKTHPAIFASRNHQYKKTDADHIAYFGYILGVKVLNEEIRIDFVSLQSIPQQLLNDNLTLFGLSSSWGINELDNIHWAIKKVNLVDTLKRLGLRILSY